jgi:hypothetical protein
MKKIFVTLIVMVAVACFICMAESKECSMFNPVADVNIGANGIAFMPKVANAGMILSVSVPDGTVFSKTFEAGSSLYLSLSALSKNYPPDGLYTYELRTVAVAGPRVRKSPETAGLVKEKNLIRESLVQNGYFSVREGMIITSNAVERGVGITQEVPSRPLDEVIYDDLIVDGSLCVGNDCYSGYAFGFDTIVLMENNLRIYFDDTSNTSSFPNNDWRIICNDTTDGGGAYFALQDVSGGLTPFTIEAGAKTNSLYVDDDGQVGIGTSGPVFELHIKEGDTPSVRLHQSTAYGWPEQIWDVGGNETSFFVRDGTHAARLPFRIEPETPTSTLCLKSDGKVGIGTWSPEYTVEIETTGENAGLYLDRTDGVTFKLNVTDTLAQIGTVSDDKVNFVVNNSAVMTINTSGYVGISDTTPDYPLDMGTIAPGAYCTTGGVWHSASSREYKENIRNLTAEEAMATLVELNPVRFNYKVDKEDEYVGFISEDVPELVASKDRKGMTAMDIVAVLTKVAQEQQKAIQGQQKTISELKKEIAELKKK